MPLDDAPVTPLWKPGDQVLIRFRRRGPVSYANPVTVVHDGPDHTALYLRPGTPVKHRVLPDGTPIPRDMPYAQRATMPVLVGDGIWQWNHVLWLVRPGEAYSVGLFWGEADWAFRGWYVDLQDPVRRVPTGFDTADHVLDIQVAPDGVWSWKDEHEMAEAVRIGHFSQAEAGVIRTAGEAVISTIEARRWPFDRSLIDWRPDPAWPMPTMPLSWNDEAFERRVAIQESG